MWQILFLVWNVKCEFGTLLWDFNISSYKYMNLVLHAQNSCLEVLPIWPQLIWLPSSSSSHHFVLQFKCDFFFKACNFFSFLYIFYHIFANSIMYVIQIVQWSFLVYVSDLEKRNPSVIIEIKFNTNFDILPRINSSEAMRMRKMIL